jgi:hypothetical protein
MLPTKYSNYQIASIALVRGEIMGLGSKIMAGIALVVAAMVIKRYMKRERKRKETDR